MTYKKLKIIFELYRSKYTSVKLMQFEKYYVLTVDGIKKVFTSQSLLLIYLERGL